jgi:hypothetical protein
VYVLEKFSINSTIAITAHARAIRSLTAVSISSARPLSTRENSARL